MVAPELRAELQPPAGWAWYDVGRRPTESGPTDVTLTPVARVPRFSFGAEWEALIQALDAWCCEWDVPVTQMRGTNIQVAGRRSGAGNSTAHVPWRVTVDIGASRDEALPSAWLVRNIDCPFCEATIRTGVVACPECNGSLVCRSCYFNADLAQLDRISVEPEIALRGAYGSNDEGHCLGCSTCYGECNHVTGVHDEIDIEEYCGRSCMLNSRQCVEHTEFVNCAYCDFRMIESSVYLVANEFPACRSCHRQRCTTCGAEGAQVDPHSDTMLCAEHFQAAQQGRVEAHDPDATVGIEDLILPALPNRPIRVMSIEQEFVGNADMRAGGTIARGLFDMGLCWAPERLNYHAGMHEHACHVERDSSVESGGELIHNRLLMSRPEDAENMARILSYMTDRVVDGSIQFDVRCGLHAHIDIHGYTFADVRGLVTLFNWMEDPIFRLAGAGYNEHRAISHGSRYSRSIRKGNWRTDREFGVDYLRNVDHADALNLLNFYQSLRQRCQCGAVEFGDLAECECNRGKATAEWRVFNGTTNPRKLHAYMAFMQSVHAWVQQRPIDPDDFPPLGVELGLAFDGSLGNGHRYMIEQWKPRVEFWFTHLPMTDSERDSLVYTMKRSSLIHLGEDYIDNLLTLERVADERTITAPNFAARDLTGGLYSDSHPEYDDSGERCEYCDRYIDDCECVWCSYHDCPESECVGMSHPSEAPRRNMEYAQWSPPNANSNQSAFNAAMRSIINTTPPFRVGDGDDISF